MFLEYLLIGICGIFAQNTSGRELLADHDPSGSEFISTKQQYQNSGSETLTASYKTIPSPESTSEAKSTISLEAVSSRVLLELSTNSTEPTIPNLLSASYRNNATQFTTVFDDSLCSSSWRSWMSRWTTSSYVRPAPTIRTSVLVFETIKSFGPNTTYTECNGIARLRFLSPPTKTSNSFVTVTITRDLTVQPSDEDLPKDPLDPQNISPICKLSQKSCEDLQAFSDGEVGNGMDPVDIFVNDIGRRPLYPDSGPSGSCPIFDRFCGMELHEVALIYWPDDTPQMNRELCASEEKGFAVLPSRTADSAKVTILTTTAITFRGRDLYVRTVNGISDFRNGTVRASIETDISRDKWNLVTGYLKPTTVFGNFSFTYPTPYIAHREITADWYSWSMTWDKTLRSWVDGGTRGSTFLRSAGVFPVQSTHIFSLRRRYRDATITAGIETAQHIAKGKFRPILDADFTLQQFATEPLDFRLLADPVPASIYYDARYQDCWAAQTHCDTITDDSYRPRLAFARSVWSTLLPSGMHCLDPMVVDPPIALRAIPVDTAVELSSDLSPPTVPYDQPDAVVTTSITEPDGHDSGHGANGDGGPTHPLPGRHRNGPLRPRPTGRDADVSLLGGDPKYNGDEDTGQPNNRDGIQGGGRNAGYRRPLSGTDQPKEQDRIRGDGNADEEDLKAGPRVFRSVGIKGSRPNVYTVVVLVLWIGAAFCMFSAQ